jgi:uncharacterized protein YfdQ (DUF2303 family)
VETDKAALEFVSELAIGQNRPGIYTTEAEHFIVVPEGTELKSLKEYQFAEPPVTKAGAVKVQDVAGFAFYFNRFKAENSMIFGSPKAFAFVGILDYHEQGAGEARHRRHGVTLTLETTQRWKTWKAMNGLPKGQEEFATFIEDNLADIYAPSDEPSMPAAADMLEISRSLEASTAHTFKQSTNLKNGQRVLQYNEQINGVAGQQGDMTIPDEFIIRLPIFLNQKPVEVRCRLRFRISGGKLSMWFSMIRVDELLAAEFEAARQAVVAATSCEVVLGEA